MAGDQRDHLALASGIEMSPLEPSAAWVTHDGCGGQRLTSMLTNFSVYVALWVIIGLIIVTLVLVNQPLSVGAFSSTCPSHLNPGPFPSHRTRAACPSTSMLTNFCR